MALKLDREVIARIAQRHGGSRIRLFGSALTDRFDPERSDVDLLVEFQGGIEDPFDAYFGLKEDLEAYFGRSFDLVMSNAIRNPYFRSEVEAHAQELYTAWDGQITAPKY